MTNPAEPNGPSDFVKEAYALDDDEKRVEFYRKWADAYDQQMLDALSYTSPLDIPDASYGDAAISSGTFTYGHVGPEPLDELFRILKPAGILACTVHQDLWQKQGFEAKFRALVNSRLIEWLSLEKGQYYEQGELEGWFCVYRKL